MSGGNGRFIDECSDDAVQLEDIGGQIRGAPLKSPEILKSNGANL